jgi:ubiquinone/menaquinone biosynthesis C-methylase UbiE
MEVVLNQELSKIINRQPVEFVFDSIPVFSPRSVSERQDDKYDKDFQFVDYYTAYYAFGHITLHNGCSESLYRTINSIILSKIDRKEKFLIADLGCGVGRTEYDLADLFPNSHFVGIDYAYNMLIRAKEILYSGKKLMIDMSNDGIGKVLLQTKLNHGNISLVQADALNLPFKPDSFDCVLNTFLIDRVGDPIKSIKNSIEILKSGGFFILTNPLNYLHNENWKKLGTIEKVLDIVERSGIKIFEAFDNLAYKQLLDARGNYRDWKTLVICGTKQ